MEAQSELFSTSAPEPWQMEGRRLKAAGMATAAAAEQETSDWSERFDMEVNRVAATGLRFTSADILAVVGQPSHYNATAARMHAAARAGIIQKVGFTEAEKASRHRAIVAVWVGC